MEMYSLTRCTSHDRAPSVFEQGIRIVEVWVLGRNPAAMGSGPFREEGAHEDLRTIFSMHGEALTLITTKKLGIKSSTALANLRIKCILLKHPPKRERLTYQEELNYLVTNDKRNLFLTNLLKHLNGNTLCLFQLVEKHGKVLYDKMKERENVFFWD